MAHTCSSSHPYAGQHAAIATMHGKEAVIAPILEQSFGMRLTLATGINTDALGTFSGEVPRVGTMLDAARAKAQLALARTKAQFGLGSEGAFGPDPLIPFLASGLELLLLLERKSGHEIVVHRRTPTNFDHTIVAPNDDLAPFLNRIGFPEHAVIVKPEHHDDANLVTKGLTTLKCERRNNNPSVATESFGCAGVKIRQLEALCRVRLRAGDEGRGRLSEGSLRGSN